ncbi:MAG: ABC transporter ATP-binding protein [Chlorobiaceae bacterium]
MSTEPPPPGGTAVRLSGISKSFGEVTANSNISLEIREGSIHALVGENGAGKSTLSKIIYGMLRPTTGELLVRGQPVRFDSPRDAIRMGIGMVHQHFMLTGELSVAENIMLGHEESSLFGRLKMSEINSRIRRESEAYGLSVDPEALAGTLSVGLLQRVEILKLLLRQASIMIFDEPTAVLSPQETEQLFRTLRSLQERGKTILLITHKLDEVLAVADTVSVMRRGEIIGTLPAKEVTKPELARMMVGRSVILKVDNPPASPGEEILSIRNLSFRNPKGGGRLRNLSLNVRAGEIYGIAGVEGNGQSELLETLWGLYPTGTVISGEVTFKKEPLTAKSPAEIAGMGVSFVPEDRLRYAVITEFPVRENLVFGRHRERAFRHGIGFDGSALDTFAKKMIADYAIDCDNPASQPLRSLSGGNQQKIVVARELTRPNNALLILAQPTRGVDIGSIETIHRKIIEARLGGMAILLVSSELEEIIALSTRIGCIYRGEIRHEFSMEETGQKRHSEPEFQKEIGLHIT